MKGLSKELGICRLCGGRTLRPIRGNLCAATLRLVTLRSRAVLLVAPLRIAPLGNCGVAPASRSVRPVLYLSRLQRICLSRCLELPFGLALKSVLRTPRYHGHVMILDTFLHLCLLMVTSRAEI
jgi:hypothetical protein